MNFSLLNKAAIAPEQLYKLFRSVLKPGVALIRKCGFTRNNHQPWVSYVNEWGQSCSHFLKRSLFSGFDINFQNNWATVTDLRTGEQHTVKLDSVYCSCKAFRASNFCVCCNHIKAVAQIYPDLQQAIAQHDLDEHIEQQAEVIAPEFKVGDRVRVNCTVNGIKQKRLGVVTALSAIGIDIDLIVKFDDNGEHVRCESSQAEKWGVCAASVKSNPALSEYRFGARSLKQNAENWRLVQAMRQQVSPEEARESIFGY